MCSSPYFGGGGGALKGAGVHNLLMQFSSLGSSKIEISEANFFYILTIKNEQIFYVKQVLAPLHFSFRLFGSGGGGWPPAGVGRNLLMQFSCLGGSGMVFPLSSLTCFDEGKRDSGCRVQSSP